MYNVLEREDINKAITGPNFYVLCTVPDLVNNNNNIDNAP